MWGGTQLQYGIDIGPRMIPRSTGIGSTAGVMGMESANGAARAPRVYSYKRFSTPEQLQGDSLRRQTALAERWAEAHGLVLDDQLTFQDLGVSAFRGKHAETGALGPFLAAIEAGVVQAGDVLLVESLDRLSRQTVRRALRVLERIIEAGVKVVTLDTGREFTVETLDTDMLAILEFVMRAALAHEESVKKARRVRDAWQNKRETLGTGAVLTRMAPAWLRHVDGDWQVTPERADVVRRMFELAASGAGPKRIAVALNRDGVPTFGKAAFWQRAYVHKILKSSAVVGRLETYQVEHPPGGRRVRRKTGQIVDGYWPAIVPMALWETVSSAKAGPAPRAEVTSLLATLAKCPMCQGTMTRILKHGKPKLVCARAKMGAGCRYRSVLQARVEKALVEGIERAAAEAPVPDEDIQRELERLEATILGCEEGIDALVEMAERRAMPFASVERRLEALEVELEQLRREHQDALKLAILKDARGVIVRQSAAVAACEAYRRGEYGVATVNAALRSALSSVTIDYRSGQLVLEWRGGGCGGITYEIDWGDGVRSYPYDH
jgi:DNA invertase Pin-like site-specific DNA recombinase